MGIKGLYTYISSKVPSAFEWLKLKDCSIVIDGSNLAYHIYLYTENINLAYGGDYALYADNIRDFFIKLLKCNITPLVVMDGGHPLHNKKFETIKRRMIDQISSCQIIDPKNQHSSQVFPLMIRSVFTNVLLKLGVKCVTADFEADADIAVIAKTLNCYVLSNDSDFFLQEVKLIILNSLNMDKIKENSVEKKGKTFLTCYKFNRQQFCKIVGVNLKLLPLLAVIVGNDCHPIEVMAGFINSISSGRYQVLVTNAKRYELLKCSLHWLSVQTSNDPATILRKITSRIQKLNAKSIDSIKDCLKGYYPKKSNILPWFKKHDENCPAADVSVETSSIRVVDFKCVSNLPDNVASQMECSCRKRQQSSLGFDTGLPKWFTFCFRFNIAPCISTELLNQPCIFAQAQIEDTSKANVQLNAENIIIAIRGILWKSILRPDNKCINANDKKSNATSDASLSNIEILRKAQKTKMIPRLLWYMRKGDGLWNKAIEKTSIKNYNWPNLYQMEKLTSEEKKKLFYEIVGFNGKFLSNEDLPKNLEFILLCIYHWRVVSKDVTDSIFYSVIISVIMFLIVSGRHNLKKEHYDPVKANKYRLQVDSMMEGIGSGELEAKSLAEIIDSITIEECQLARFNLSLFDRETKRLKSNYRRSVVHYFSAYQGSVFYLGALNSVLGFPFSHTCISIFWSGTFCYSMERFLDSEESPFKSIKLLLNVNKKIIHIFDRMCNLLHRAFEIEKTSVKDTITEEELQVHREKIRNIVLENVEDESIVMGPPECDVVESPTVEDIEMMSGNSFGALLLPSMYT